MVHVHVNRVLPVAVFSVVDWVPVQPVPVYVRSCDVVIVICSVPIDSVPLQLFMSTPLLQLPLHVRPASTPPSPVPPS
jgi:hypothetical protein